MSGLASDTFQFEFHKHRQAANSVHRQQGTAVDLEFNAPFESPLSAELTGNIFTMLGRLSSANSNVQHLVTTVSEHATTADLTDILDAQQNSNQIKCSRRGRRVQVQVGSGSRPVLQLRGHAYIAPFRGWAASHLHLFAPSGAEHAEEQVIESTQDTVAEATLAAAAPAAHPAAPQGHQLVTVVINIHDDALQQALHQAQQDLYRAQGHSASLQQQINALTAQLQFLDQELPVQPRQQQPADSAMDFPDVDVQDDACSSKEQVSSHGESAHGDTALASSGSVAASSVSEVPTVAADLQQPRAPAASHEGSSELEQLRQQLQDLQDQTSGAESQRSASLQLVETLRGQLAQQGSSLEREVSRRKALRKQLASAEQEASQAAAEVVRFRSESSQLSQQLESAQDTAITAAPAHCKLQQQLQQLRAEKEQVERQLTQAQDQVHQLQALVGSLQDNLADAKQEATSATEALSAVTEQADRLRAAAEASEHLQTAAGQQACKQTSTISELEHRLQEAASELLAHSSLNRARESASSADAARQQDTQGLQARLDVALEQKQAAASVSSGLAETVQQLRDSLASTQAVSVAETAAHEKAVSKLIDQVADLRQQVTASLERAAASAEAQQVSASQQAAQTEAIRSLQSRLQEAESRLHQEAEEATTVSLQQQQSLAALQGRLHQAVDQAAAAETAKSNMASSVVALAAHLQAAKAEAASQGEAHAASAALTQGQIAALQQQLAELQQQGAAAAETATALKQQLATAKQSASASQAARQLAVASREGIVGDLQQQLVTAQEALQQNVQSAAAANAAKQDEIAALEVKLSDAVQQAETSKAARTELAAVKEQLQVQAQSAEAALTKQIASHDVSAASLQSRITALQRQLREAGLQAESAVTKAATAATNAASQRHQAEAAHSKAVGVLQGQLQDAQSAMQQSMQSAAATQDRLQNEVQVLQVRLHETQQKEQGVHILNRQLSDSTNQLTEELESARSSLDSHSQASQSRLGQLQNIVHSLQQQLAAAEQASETAVAHAAVCEQRAVAAEASCQHATAAAEQAAAASTAMQAELEGKLQQAQHDLVIAQEAAESLHAEQEATLQTLQQQLTEASQQEQQHQGITSTLQSTVDQLTNEIQSAEAALAAEKGDKDASVSQLQTQVAALEQQLTDAASQTAAAAATHERASQEAASALHQAAWERSSLVLQHEHAMQDFYAAHEQSTAAALSSHTRNLEFLQENLNATVKQLQTSHAKTAERDATIAALKAEMHSVQNTAATDVSAAKGQVQELQQQVDSLRRQLQAETSAADIAARETASLEGIVADLKAMCDQCRAEAGKAAAKLQQSQAAQSALEGQVTHWQSEASNLRTQLKEHQQALAEKERCLEAETAKADSASTSVAAIRAVLATAQADATEQLAMKDTVMQQLLGLSQRHAELQRALHDEQQQHASAQQDVGVASSQSKGLQAQVIQLQADVQHYQEQTESASHACEEQQQLVQQLQGQLADAERHNKVEVDNMQAEVVGLTIEISGIKEAMTVLQQQPSLHLLRQLSLQQPSSQQPSSEQPSADQTASEQPSTAGPRASAPSHPPLNTLSITDIIAQSYDALGLQSPLTPLTLHTRERQAGLLDALLLDAASSARPELVVTNPVYLDGDLQASVPPTPMAVAPSQAVLHQAGLLSLIEQQLRDSLAKLNTTRAQLSEAEQQSNMMKQQQEGAEDLVRALRHELHSLRQDTNSVAAGARQTISEKEALQATLEVAQAALMNQSEEMRQVTADRDALLMQLRRGSSSTSPTPSSPTLEDSIPAYQIERHNSQQSVSGSWNAGSVSSSGRKVRLSTASTTSDSATSRPKWTL